MTDDLATGLIDRLRHQLRAERTHLLGTLDGLGEPALQQTPLPSRWTLPQLLVHVAHDDEMFWVSGVLDGDPRAAAAVEAGQDGWQLGLGVSGDEAIRVYTEEIERSEAVLDRVDLAAPPAWWPEGLFGNWKLERGYEVLLHLVSETCVHGGHADAARELIDGHQHIVLD